MLVKELSTIIKRWTGKKLQNNCALCSLYQNSSDKKNKILNCTT